MNTLTYSPNSQSETRDTGAGITSENDFNAESTSLATRAGGIAHDINNMLTGILGSVSLAMMELNSSDESHKFLEQAEDAIMKTRQLTKQLSLLESTSVPGACEK